MNSVSHSFKSLFFYFVFSGACVTNLVVFFLCYHSSNSLRLVVVQTCGKFGCKQTHLFRPTISTSMSCLVVSSAVSILCFRESFNLKLWKHTVYNIKTCLLHGYESSKLWVRIILALGTNHLNFGYKSSRYKTSVGTKRLVKYCLFFFSPIFLQQFISISTCTGKLNAEKVMELNRGECHTPCSKRGSNSAQC